MSEMKIDFDFKKEFTKEQISLFKRLNTPQKIQDYLDLLPINFENHGETYMSAKATLERNHAHCFEAALVAAAILRFYGQRPLLLDLETKGDTDHVVALFQQHGRWGAISKTNHSVLRYRDPVYKSVRELVMSYFHEYFTSEDRKKRLRAYKIVDLTRFDKYNWMTSSKNLWDIVRYLQKSSHTKIMGSTAHIKSLRLVSMLEMKMSDLPEWQNVGKVKEAVSVETGVEALVVASIDVTRKPLVLTYVMPDAKEG